MRPPGDAIDDANARVIPSLIGEDARDQVSFDARLREIDGTGNFQTIGGNIAVALSLANANAAASALGLELFSYLGGIYATTLPLPLGNVIGGGAHAEGSTEIQEFLVVPGGAADTREAVFSNAAVHKAVRDILRKRGKNCGKGDEGAWAPAISDLEAFEIVTEAAGLVSDERGIKVEIGLDVAASQFWDPESDVYRYRSGTRSTEEQIEYIAGLIDKFDLIYVEDPLHEDDFEGFADLTSLVGDHCLICGDDIFVTNPSRIQEGIDMDSANCVLIKPNQIGTLTDTYGAVHLAHTHGMDTVMSHRSGETTDATISHLATAFHCIFLKTGAVGGERAAKLNELIRIEEIIA